MTLLSMMKYKLLNLLKHHSDQFRSFLVNSDANRIPKPSIIRSTLDLNIPEDHVSLATLEGKFSEEEELINQGYGTTSAASSDYRMQTVKNKSSTVPFIVTPLTKNANYYQCKCPTFSLYQICAHVIATTENNGPLLDYVVEIKNKVKRSTQKD